MKLEDESVLVAAGSFEGDLMKRGFEFLEDFFVTFGAVGHMIQAFDSMDIESCFADIDADVL